MQKLQSNESELEKKDREIQRLEYIIKSTQEKLKQPIILTPRPKFILTILNQKPISQIQQQQQFQPK
jgi:hypothetical protein